MARRFVALAFAAAALALAPVAGADQRVVFVVHFDWDSTALSVEGADVVEQAAPRARACESNGVRVIGHADTSEENVSEVATARAKAVRDALVARGVANSAIGVTGQGDRKLALQTDDGVREALNRRAEIVLVCG